MRDEMMARMNAVECDNKVKKGIFWFFAMIGGVAVVAGIAYLVYKFMNRDAEIYYEDDFDDDFDDFFGDDYDSKEDLHFSSKDEPKAETVNIPVE